MKLMSKNFCSKSINRGACYIHSIDKNNNGSFIIAQWRARGELCIVLITLLQWLCPFLSLFGLAAPAKGGVCRLFCPLTTSPHTS